MSVNAVVIVFYNILVKQGLQFRVVLTLLESSECKYENSSHSRPKQEQ